MDTYIELDAHASSCTLGVLRPGGKRLGSHVVETNAQALIEGTSGAARAGTLVLAHGSVETPAFMPVGTQTTVRALSPYDLRTSGTQMVLANTYHLHVRPGEDVVETLGRLHRFMGWDRPILTDSGGFQVLS